MNLSKEEYDMIIEASEPTAEVPLAEINQMNSFIQHDNIKVILVNIASLDYSNDINRGKKQDKRPCYGLYSIKYSLINAGYYTVIIDMEELRLAPIDIAYLINQIFFLKKGNLFVGVNGYSPNRSIIEKTARIICKINPNINLVFGGRLVSIELAPNKRFIPNNESITNCISTINAKNIFAIIGEAEECFPLLIKHINNKLNIDFPYIEYRELDEYKYAKKSNIISNEDFEYYDDFIPPHYKATLGNQSEYYAMLSSRSCNFGCSFCAAKYFPRRVLSVPFIKAKILKTTSKDLNINIDFIDDNVLSDINRSREIIDMMYYLNENGHSIKWRALARGEIIVKLSEIGYLEKATKSGLEEVAIGFESVSDRLLKKMNKGITFNTLNLAVSLLHSTNIRVKIFAMIGIEDETKAEMEATLSYIKQNTSENGRFSVFIKSPYAGTIDHKKLLKKGWSYWDLQLYTEAACRGGKLIEYVDKLDIKFSEIGISQMNQLLNKYEMNI